MAPAGTDRAGGRAGGGGGGVGGRLCEIFFLISIFVVVPSLARAWRVVGHRDLCGSVGFRTLT